MTTRLDIQQVLNEMQALRERARNIAADRALVPTGIGAAQGDGSADFKAMLGDAIRAVNETQMEAGRLGDAYVAGEPVELARVMVALQKANVSFQAVTEVRNRLVDAYQKIMNMPV